jgi:hypothetical protein
MSRSHAAAIVALLFATAALRAQNPDSALQAAVDRDPWPRKATTSSGLATIYQPQVDSWKGNKLTFHAAVSFQKSDSSPPVFGVVFASARTETDKDARTVTLEDMKLTGAKYPSRPDSVSAYLKALRATMPDTARTIALDRLQMSLLVVTDKNAIKTVSVKNTPPTIYFSQVPAILVLINGKPAPRAVPGTSAQRIINTGVLIVYTGDIYYLKIFDGWMQSLQLNGQWSVAYDPPPVLDSALTWAKTQRIDLLTGASPDSAEAAPSLWAGTVPVIYASTTPAELIVTQGQPNYVPVGNTNLLYISNTSARVFEYIDNQQIYALISGRWFTAPATYGPWTYVPGSQLPPDFHQIPLDSPMEPVLASVPGTPQAQEALIENSVPQTGSVSRSTTMPAPEIDGQPLMAPVTGTSLQYVTNSSVPIIRIAPGSFYSVYNGVWFTSATAAGPWTVAAIVPAAIYTIPPSSPLYYVTYVQVYGATSTVVYVGYTPGYYGTVVAPDGTVIYGTGYIYPAWVGAYYYPPPMTYGFGACVRWTPWTGWSVGFGFGYAYGGVAVSMTFGGAMWGVHPYYGPAYYGGHYGYGSWAGTTGNMYSHYGSTSAVTNRSGGYNAYTGNGWSHNMGASYNSATGIAAAGQRTTVGNAYTGGYASYASGTVANTNTGRSTSVSSLQTNYGSAVKVGNNVYGDANGNVFKDNGGGSWSQWSGGGGGGGGLGGGGGSGGWGNWGGSRSMNSQAWSRDAGASRASSFSGGGWGGGGGFGGGRR